MIPGKVGVDFELAKPYIANEGNESFDRAGWVNDIPWVDSSLIPDLVTELLDIESIGCCKLEDR